MKHLHFNLASMSLSLIFSKENHPLPDVYSTILPSCLVSPGSLLLIACLCVVANGGICSSRTPAGNCIWIVSIVFLLHVIPVAFCCISYHNAPRVLIVVMLRVLGELCTCRWPETSVNPFKQLWWCFWSLSLIGIRAKQPNEGGFILVAVLRDFNP